MNAPQTPLEVLTKRGIARQLSKRLGMKNLETAVVVQNVIDILTEHLAAGGRIELRGFGVFEIRERKALLGRNPRNPKERVEVPARRVVKYKAGKELIDRLDAKTA